MQNPNGLDRRNFLKAGTGLAAAGLAMANASAANLNAPEEYGVHWYPFLEHPDSDTCWSLSVGPDGRVYAAACVEGVAGGVVKPVRYNEKQDGLDYHCRASVGTAVNESFEPARMPSTPICPLTGELNSSVPLVFAVMG
jgi:hypothetical protein